MKLCVPLDSDVIVEIDWVAFRNVLQHFEISTEVILEQGAISRMRKTSSNC